MNNRYINYQHHIDSHGGVEKMTLVQANIADNGNSIILLADRQLTMQLSPDLSPYEFEAKTPKIFFHENVGMGFAGSGLYADVAASKISDKKDFDEIASTITTYISETRKDIIEKTIKRLTGVDSDMFFQNPNLPIPLDIRGMIYSEIRELKLCHCIIAGFDKKSKARMIITDDVGDQIEATNFSVVSIGSGSPFSQVYFDQYGYDCKMSTKEAILFAFEAKRWAQSHTGVGETTDMLVFVKDKKDIKVKEIFDNSTLMKKLKDTYQAEMENKKIVRDNLIEKMFKGEDGIC